MRERIGQAKPTFSIVVKLTISILLLLFLFYHIDFYQLIAHMKNSHLGFLLMGGVLFVSVVVFDAIRFCLLKPGQGRSGIQESFKTIREFSKINYASLAVSNIGLGSVGAELYKILALKKHFDGYANSTMAILLVRLIALLTTSFLFFISLINLGYLSNFTDKIILFIVDFQNLLIGSLLLFFCLSLLLILFRARFNSYFTRSQATIKKIIEYYNGIPKSSIVKLFFISVVVDGFRAVSLLMFLAAFNVHLEFWQLLFVSTIGTLIIFIPFSWNGLGVREVSIVGLLSGFGIDWETASAIAFSSRVVMIIISFLGFLFVSIDDNSNPDK